MIRDDNGKSIVSSSTSKTVRTIVNGTAMCVANGKDINDWLTTKDTFDLFAALADDLSIEVKTGEFRDLDIARLSGLKYSKIFPGLISSKRGSPDTGGGTWLHPDLAIQLAQWCSKPFAIQVSRWIREWITTGQNPIWAQQADMDRVIYRDTLKDQSRLRMTNQVKTYLEMIKKYDDKKFSGQFFAKVHDAINIAIAGQTSKQMRLGISQVIGREIKDYELIRDYFPALALQRYISVCEAAANFMLRHNLHPLTAVERAAEIVLPANYIPEIDFNENIKFVRERLVQPIINQPKPPFLL
jgi:hypothetical protein